MAKLIWAILAITTWAGFVLLLEGAMRIWPIGAAGAYSRVITVALLLVWVGARGLGWPRLNPRGVGGWLLLMGAVSAVINICWFAGMRWTTATNTAMLFRLDLLFVVLIGAAMGIERISKLGAIVAPVMLAGLALLVNAHQLEVGEHFAGDMLIVVAALGLAINAFVIRRILRAMDAEAVATFNHAASGVAFAAILLIEGFELPEPVQNQPIQWGWIAALGVGSAIALPIYYAALRRMAVWKLRAYMLTGPVLVAVADWLIWGEMLHGWQWLGAILLLGGAGALAWGEIRKAPDATGNHAEAIELQRPVAPETDKRTP